MNFEDLELNEDLLDALYDMRFEKCTPIQEQCIPYILANRDLIGIAQTGTGKTAAYLLPLLTLLRRDPHPSDAVNCLIMARHANWHAKLIRRFRASAIIWI